MRDVNHQLLVEKLAVKLKGIAVPPTWAAIAKTGHGKQRPPVRGDWWQVRAAAVLLSVEKLGPVGVSKLSVKYGNRKNRGMKTEKFAPGSGNIIRKILQQLETAKLIQQTVKDSHKGRIVTKQGTKLIIECAKEVKKESGEHAAVKKAVKIQEVVSSASSAPAGEQKPRRDKDQQKKPKEQKEQ